MHRKVFDISSVPLRLMKGDLSACLIELVCPVLCKPKTICEAGKMIKIFGFGFDFFF